MDAIAIYYSNEYNQTIEKAYGFNSSDGCDRIFTLNGNHLVIAEEVSK